MLEKFKTLSILRNETIKMGKIRIVTVVSFNVESTSRIAHLSVELHRIVICSFKL